MKAFLVPQNRTVELSGPQRVRDIIAALGVTPGTVMVIRGESLLTEADVVAADDEVEIRSVISGGSQDTPRPLSRR